MHVCNYKEKHNARDCIMCTSALELYTAHAYSELYGEYSGYNFLIPLSAQEALE